MSLYVVRVFNNLIVFYLYLCLRDVSVCERIFFKNDAQILPAVIAGNPVI